MDICITIGENKVDCFDNISDAITYLEQVENSYKAIEQAKEAINKVKEICNSYSACYRGCPFYCGEKTISRKCYFINYECPDVWNVSDLDTLK